MELRLFSGVFDLPWWGNAIVALALTHVTIASVTIFLHRHQAHHALDLHPAVSHFFRLWLWLTTGMVTREWAAVHRKHHAKVETPEEVAAKAPTDPRTFAVVMTHNYLRDREYLRGLLKTDVGYVAMLGPAARTQRLLMDLEEEGVALSEDDRARIHGPAGLDLGAEGPEEIAQAIVAQIVAVRHGRQGGHLRERPGPIHDRPRPGTEAR